MTDQLYVQRDQPPGVPPLHLTGERTLPDVPEENYWYRRHLVVYEWIAQRAHGRRVVDLACGEGYGCAVLAATAASVVGVDANPEAFEHARAKYPQVTLRAQHDRAVAGRRRLRRVPADDRAHPGPGRDARPRPRADRARRRRLRLHAERAHARARRAPSAPATRGTCASTSPASTASCASATSPTSTCSASSTRASCARTRSRSSASAGTACTRTLRFTKPFYDRFTPAISARDFTLRRVGLDKQPRPARGAADHELALQHRPAHPHALRGGLRDVAVRRGVAVGGDRDQLPAAAGRPRRPPGRRDALDHPRARRPARGAGRAGALPGVPARDPPRVPRPRRGRSPRGGGPDRLLGRALRVRRGGARARAAT